MGSAERKNPLSNRNVPADTERVGAFNVTVRIEYADLSNEVIDCDRWVHGGDYLALSINPAKLRIVSLKNVKYFEVTPQPKKVEIAA
jgi:hypothetical protein